MNITERIKHFQQHPEEMESALYPGKQLADFDPDNLKVDIFTSGFHSLDKALLLKKNRGEFILIGARPSHGKSAALFQLATNVAKAGKVHVFSLEMDHDSVVTRQVAALINRPIDAIQGGYFKPQVIEAKQQLESLNFHIDDRSGITIDEICDAARAENARSKTDAIFIDYIQIIRTDKGHNRANEVALVSAKLKALAKELRVPVIAASQLNRNNEMRENKAPQLSDLKESGSLEQDADIVILLHRDPREPSIATIDIAKNRNGPTKVLTFEYAAAQTRFIEREYDSI